MVPRQRQPARAHQHTKPESQKPDLQEEQKVGSILPSVGECIPHPRTCGGSWTSWGWRVPGLTSLFPRRIRMSGIKGLQGVVRKTVNDELQANIWDPQHMDKIVPSLLFNLQHVEEAER